MMARGRTALPLVAALSIAGTALLAVAPAANATGKRVPTFPHYSAAQFAAEAAAAPAGLTAALAAQVGTTPAEFYAQGAAGAAADATLAGLRNAGVDVLRSHLDDTELVVHVASAQDAALVTQAGATPALGAPEASATPAVVRTMSDPELTTGLHGGVGWSVPNPTDPTWTWQCSVGFSGVDAITGAHEFLTAGHCASNAASHAIVSTLGTDVRDACTSNDSNCTTPLRPSPTMIGTVMTTANRFGDGYDSGLVALDSGIRQKPDVTTWGDASPLDGSPAPNQVMGTASIPITGAAAAVQGQTVCHSGYRTGWQCGTVTAVDRCTDATQVGNCEQVIDDSGIAHTVNAIETTVCVQEGDSGGPLVAGGVALGVLSGGNWNYPNPDGTTPILDSDPTPVCSGRNTVLQTQDPNRYCGGSPCTSVFFPLISATGALDVAHQLPDWELLTTTGPIRLNPGVPLVPATFAATTAPTITGTIRVGKTVTARLSPWNPAADPKTVTIQWLLDGKPIARQTTTSLAITPAMGGHRLSLRITASRTNYTPAAVTSRTYAVALATLTAMPAPTIVGPKEVGHTLSARAGTWKPGGVRLHYQWFANGHPIRGATGRTLTLTTALRGRTIQVRVTGTKTGYLSHYSTSKKTPRIA